MAPHMPREIHTERLLLRAVSVEDAAAQVEAIAQSVEELAEWMPWCSGPQTLEQARENLAGSAVDFERGSGFEYAMWQGETFVGRIGVHAVDLGCPRARSATGCAPPSPGADWPGRRPVR